MTRTKALSTAALLLTVLLLPFVTSAADSTVTVNTTWSGTVSLSGNVTVASGATLVVAPGTEVDAGEFSIVVEGTLEADQASFFSSVTPLTQGSHGQGIWPGIVVESGGVVDLNEVMISNASAGVLVKGNLSATKVVFNDAYRGISVVGGHATVNDFTANRMDYEALYVESGTLYLETGLANEVAVGLANHDYANLTDFTVREAGVGVQSQAGIMELHGLGLVNASVGIATVSGAQTNISSVQGSGLALGMDLGDADDFTLVNGQFTGQRFIVGQGATAFNIHDTVFAGDLNETRAAVDVRCDGQCSMHTASLVNTAIGMTWSGAGTSIMENVSVSSSLQAVEAAGTGTPQWANLTLQSDHTGLVLQTTSSSLTDINVGLTAPGVGIDVLGGQHSWSNVLIHKPFMSSDQTSVGLKAWYADIEADQISTQNVSTGFHLEDSTGEIDQMEANIGHHAGVHLIDSTLEGEGLITVAQDYGVLMEGQTSLHLSSWTAQLHDTPLMMSTGSDAVVRSFSPQNTAPSSSDALGDGTFYYGSSSNPTVSTSASYRLTETAVTFTDLQGNPVEADVHVHGFELRSNSNGALTLPLTSAGSVVDATLDGSGVRVILYGGQTGQSVQVPVIPQGDWTVGSGQDIVLGPRPDGQPHQLSGDLVVSNNGRLTLVDTTLAIASGKTVTLQGTGVLQGSDATLSSAWVQASGQSMLTGTSTGVLQIHGDIQWGCLTTRSIQGLEVEGNLTVQPSCEIELTNGSINGQVTAQTGGSFTSSSSLSISVLDKGQPVEGALISIDGSVGVTDASGHLATAVVARTVTDMGESWAGMKTVTLQRNNFTDFVTWDTNSSLEHTFMASTISPGQLNQWLVLERQWSPYSLDGDLTVQTASTMTVQDGVSLRISEGSTITVNGLFDADAATLSSTGYGARWAGLALGDSAGAVIDLSNTQLVESSPAITVSGFGEVRADGVLVARSASDPLVVIESGNQADLIIRNSRLQDSGNGCVVAYPSTGSVSLTNVSFANCDGAALWGQQVPLTLSGLIIDEGVDHGLDLTGVSGTVDGLTGHGFSGQGALVSLNSIRGDFTLSNVEGDASGLGGIIGEDNVDLVIHDVTLVGAPAIVLDLSSGTLSDLSLQGSGVGTAFTTHHGRSSQSLLVENLDVSGYSVGVALHSDEGEISAPLIVRDATISATAALATEHYPVRLESTTLMGSLDVSATDVVAVDGLVASVTPDTGATFALFRTVALEAQRDGAPVHAQFTVTYSDSAIDALVVSGTTVDVELLLRTVTEDSDSVMASWTVEAVASGSPSAERLVSTPATASDVLVVTLQTNQPPTVTLDEPFPGQRVIETDSLRASASVIDDLDDNDAVLLSWKVYDMQGNVVLQGGNEPVYNITDLGAGFYVVEVTATDSLGATSSASTDFEYTQLDTDGDWSSTCSSDTWFDAQTGKSCGPNVYDEDDDNDGFSDTKDAFPLDPCAQLDTDGDTQPDILDCPPGYTSWLTEDMDDDGDGIPDVLEGVTVDDNDTNFNALLVVLALLVVVVLLFFVRLRQGGPGDLSGLDQQHL